jgi:hypothetical protein
MFRAIAVPASVPFDRRPATSLPPFGNVEHYRSMSTTRQCPAVIRPDLLRHSYPGRGRGVILVRPVDAPTKEQGSRLP